MNEYIITTSEVEQNNVKSAPTNISGGDPVSNKHIFDKLPELIVEKFNRFVNSFNTLIDAKLAEHDTKIGAGDMQQMIYDTDKDGVVDNAKALDGYSAGYFATKEQMQAAQTAVNSKADENHTQSASTITSGTFAEDVAAYNENRETSSLRNIEIRTSSASGTLQSTNKIICVRK